MNAHDINKIGDLLDQKLEPIKKDIATLKEDVSGLKEDMRTVKRNLNDLIQQNAEILENMVTQDEHQQLKKRVTLLEQSN